MKAILGSLLSYSYNHWISNIPSRTIRGLFLKCYLKQLSSSSGVQMGVKFLNGRKISLGENSVINFGSLLDGRKFSIKIGQNVSIGPEATVLTLGHDPKSPTFENKGGDIVIEDYCWIAYRAVILPGVTIKEGSVIGAGAVVTRDTEPYGIYAGSPAVKVGERPNNMEYQLNYKPWLM